jgi:hypothetical protein
MFQCYNIGLTFWLEELKSHIPEGQKVTDFQFLQYEQVTMPRCSIEGWEIQEKNSKMHEKYASK